MKTGKVEDVAIGGYFRYYHSAKVIDYHGNIMTVWKRVNPPDSCYKDWAPYAILLRNYGTPKQEETGFGMFFRRDREGSKDLIVKDDKKIISCGADSVVEIL